VPTINALCSQQAKGLIHKRNMVDRSWQFNMSQWPGHAEALRWHVVQLGETVSYNASLKERGTNAYEFSPHAPKAGS